MDEDQYDSVASNEVPFSNMIHAEPEEEERWDECEWITTVFMYSFRYVE